jgi:Class II flagellar assembly regulator
MGLINLKKTFRFQLPADRRSCRRRQILPGRLLRLNHKPTKLRPTHLKGMAMRIYGPNGTTLGAPAASARRGGSSAFALPDTVANPETRSAAAPKAAGNIDALLAMQGIEDPLERRKRSVQRGRGALDVLDDLKIGLLSGNFDASTVSRLRDAAANLKSTSGDPGLDAVLSEIELRVEVELAKAGQF